jgi:hypothetical protein
MSHRLRSACVIVPALLSGLLTVSHASADIVGFNNLSGWRLNVGDGATPPTYDPGSDSLHLTNTGSSEFRSVFFETPQQVGQFSASFTYTVQNAGIAFGNHFGACFVIQNSPSGAAALGSSGSGLGYAGITNSVALSFEIGNSPSATGLYSGGVIGGGAAATPPVNALAGHPIDVNLSYNGSLLTLTMTDTVTLGQYQTAYPVNIPGLIGGSSAYVGFTASTTGIGNADQYFGNPHFSVPGPAALSVLGLSGLAAMRRRRTS